MGISAYLKCEVLAFFVILCWFDLNGVRGYPTSYKEPNPNQPVEMTTTPKKVKDTFQLNKQVMPIPQNDTKKTQTYKSQVSKLLNDGAFEPVTYKVKFANSGSKSTKQNEDDDDDDDGGEYEGAVDYASCKRKEQEEPQDKKSMPIMIIRGLDVMAMDLPVSVEKECMKPKEEKPKVCGDKKDEKRKDFDKLGECGQNHEDYFQNQQKVYNNGVQRDVNEFPKDSKENSWGEWSPCSKSCGIGVQSRSRAHPSGYPERDTQFKSCHLADCAEPRVYPSNVGSPSYRDLVRN
ncbi:uncharacterized protein LOC128993845 [Macrosteles quadrilineatus]|uniref:uncharacterized protein LOC128993845 n=1 Tax=Macrosteles quadrilineatus TaxID=74068 RepID=UPI0023E2DA51|nr:uncharacterized protein LOC128993845 [Macrosteles quadrilineatus]